MKYTKNKRFLLLSIIFSAMFLVIIALSFTLLSNKNSAKTAGKSPVTIIHNDETNGSDTTTAVDNSNNESVAINTDPIGDKELLVYLGNENATNEILLAFDYSCPYCHKWIREIYPSIEKFIQDGNVKLRTQSMVYLDENSLKLAKIDQNLKRYDSSHYFNVFFTLMNSDMSGDWATDAYLTNLFTQYQLDKNELYEEPKLDVINVTRKYTKALQIEGVPAVFVNGNFVENPFSLEEIQSFFN